MASIWIVNPFDPLPGDPEQPGRYATLARMLREAGHDVTWWAASFSHRFKAPLDQGTIRQACDKAGIGVRFIDTPAYMKNVSFQRIRSHRVYAGQFEEQARKEPKPDVIICSNPPIEAPVAAGRVAKSFGARLIVDVQDIWMDNFRQLLPGPMRWASSLILRPWVVASRKGYAAADAVVGVAEGYADEPKRYGRTEYTREVIQLGIDLASFDAAVDAGTCPLGEKPPGEIWSIYSGSLSRNYDVLTVARAAARVARERSDVRFIFSGKGEMEGQVRELLEGLERVTFLGFAPFNDWAATIRQCDIGWNAIWPQKLIFMPNKVFYYWSAGCGICSSIPGECADWIRHSNTGVSYPAGDVDGACKALNEMLSDRAELENRCRASRQFAEEKWDRRKLYQRYLELVDRLLV